MSRRPVTLAEAQHLREAGHSAERGADDAVQAVMDANMWELEVNALMGEVSLQEGASLFRRAQRALFEVKAVLDALEEQTVTAEDVPLAGLPPCGWNKKAVQLRFAAPLLCIICSLCGDAADKEKRFFDMNCTDLNEMY